MSSYTYVWHGTSRTPGKPQAATPSRSSRANGFTNWTHYNAFQRSDGQTFSVGDAVQVWEGFDFSHAQFWLDPYRSYGTESRFNYERRVGQPEASTSTAASSSHNSIANSKAKDASSHKPTSPRKNSKKNACKGKMAQREEEEDDWIVDDGLEDSTKFGIIADLFEDEKGNMRVAIHWLARPRLLCYAFGKTAGVEAGLDDTHRRELFYTCDPAEFMVRSRALKNSRAEDVVDVAYILSSIRVLSEQAFEGEEASDTADTPTTFFIRKALNTKAEGAEAWFYDIPWQDVREQCLACGNWELELGGAAKRAKRKAEAKVARSSPTKRRRATSSTAGDDTDHRRAGSSVTTVATSDDSDISDSSSDEEEEIDEDDMYRARHQQDDDDEGPSDEESEDEPEVQTPDDHDDIDDDMDVFGPVSSARKRKSPVKSGGRSPKKRGRVSAAVLRPSAASMRAAAQRAERKAQRLAERQARRQKPRLPLSQQRYIGTAADSMDPFEKARAVLHVGCTPQYLPCRDDEYTEIEAYLEDAIDEGVGSCIYVAGVPGTGKTATIRSVVSALQERASGGEIKSFRFLEVNGMKIADPAQSFTILWEFISGARLPAKQALAALEKHFKTPNPGRDTCVILVDELDQLVTKKQEVIYNFFNWPNQSHSRLIVLAVANTMDLPERELSNKINSRLGSNRINFKPYDRLQLTEILMSRLEGLDGVFDKAAIGLVSAKVAAVTGDARRALDICRRAVETVEAENASTGKKRVVTIGDIVKVHTSMTSSGLMQFVQRAGLHQRIMLLALSRAIRKLGIDEVEFGDVVRWHLDFCRQSAMTPLPTHAQLFSILQSLADMRLVTTEGARLDYYQRVQANVRDDELELVLRKQQQFTHLLR